MLKWPMSRDKSLIFACLMEFQEEKQFRISAMPIRIQHWKRRQSTSGISVLRRADSRRVTTSRPDSTQDAIAKDLLDKDKPIAKLASRDSLGAGTSQCDIALRWPRAFSNLGWSVRDTLRRNRPREWLRSTSDSSGRVVSYSRRGELEYW